MGTIDGQTWNEEHSETGNYRDKAKENPEGRCSEELFNNTGIQLPLAVLRQGGIYVRAWRPRIGYRSREPFPIYMLTDQLGHQVSSMSFAAPPLTGPPLKRQG